MSNVNLLPESYFRTVTRRFAYRRSAVWGLLLLVVGVGWFAASRLEARQVQRRVALEQRRLDLELEQGTVLARFAARHREFRASEGLLAELEEPVPVVAILASLARAVPEEVVLNRLVVDAPNDARGSGDSGASNAPAVTRHGGMTRAPAGARPLMIELGGLAHSDREVVRCLSRIAEQPLFVNVKLVKSRHLQDSGGSKVAFQITLEVPVDRKLIIATEVGSHGN
jgi:Tfp pilus assembly protein PilN